jgi:hypothetical protein
MNKLKVGDILSADTRIKKNELFQITGFERYWIGDQINYRAKAESLETARCYQLFPLIFEDIVEGEEII